MSSSEKHSSALEALTVTRPTQKGAVLQLVLPALALRNNVMRLPAALPLDPTVS